jgi:acyl-CoA synthetase (AMP-forming)/AMP-acid ligase II
VDTGAGRTAPDFHENHNNRARKTQVENDTAFGTKGNKTRDAVCQNLLMLMLTSGSTGNAKAVSFTHEQVLAAVSGKAGIRLLARNRPFLNWVGLDHAAGPIEIHLQAVWLGVGQVHVSAADVVTAPTTFLDLIHRHRVSLTFAPKFFLAKLVSAVESLPRMQKWDLSSLVCVTFGGEGNDIKTCVAASALFSRHGASSDVIIAGFGMTETCTGAIHNTHCPGYDLSCGYEVASLGKCMNGIEMRIVTPRPANPT